MLGNSDVEMISFGGGVNSTAMVILLARAGWRGPIVFADTGAELPETYEHIERFAEWVKQFDLEITRLHPHERPHLYKWKINGRTLVEFCVEQRWVPMWTWRLCRTEWKLRPLKRHAKGIGVERTLLGIDAGEAQRSRGEPRPLVEMGIDRAGCVKVIESAGMDVPIRSGCWLCPFRRNEQWRKLWEEHRELYELAMEIEENSLPSKAGGAYSVLDPDRVTLRRRAAEFAMGARREQMELWTEGARTLARAHPSLRPTGEI